MSKNIRKPKICATAENYKSNKHASTKMHKWQSNKLANKQLWVRLSKVLDLTWRSQKWSRVANKFPQVANIYQVPTYPMPFPSLIFNTIKSDTKLKKMIYVQQDIGNTEYKKEWHQVHRCCTFLKPFPKLRLTIDRSSPTSWSRASCSASWRPSCSTYNYF